jgi:hypothetical protein
MQRLLQTVALSIVLLAAALIHEKAKRDASRIDVCADKPTPAEIARCRHAVAYAMSAGW